MWRGARCFMNKARQLAQLLTCNLAMPGCEPQHDSDFGDIVDRVAIRIESNLAILPDAILLLVLLAPHPDPCPTPTALHAAAVQLLRVIETAVSLKRCSLGTERALSSTVWRVRLSRVLCLAPNARTRTLARTARQIRQPRAAMLACKRQTATSYDNDADLLAILHTS
eukprot:3288389-Pleurochrysis_carterae.AAC.2